jgi:hypothetical protein
MRTGVKKDEEGNEAPHSDSDTEYDEEDDSKDTVVPADSKEGK